MPKKCRFVEKSEFGSTSSQAINDKTDKTIEIVRQRQRISEPISAQRKLFDFFENTKKLRKIRTKTRPGQAADVKQGQVLVRLQQVKVESYVLNWKVMKTLRTYLSL